MIVNQGIEYTIPELQFMTYMAERDYIKAKEEGAPALTVEEYRKVFVDLAWELDYKIWLDTPVPPNIGLEVSKDFTDEDRQKADRRCKLMYYIEYMYKERKHAEKDKMEKSVHHILATLEVAKDNDITCFV